MRALNVVNWVSRWVIVGSLAGSLTGSLAGSLAWGPAVQAETADTQAGRISEAIKQIALQRGKNPGFYSDWQVKGEKIPLWSKQCAGRDLTPQQFEASQSTASGVVTCVLREMIRQEAKFIGKDESLVVRRVAAWWATGDAAQYNSPGVATYTQQVLRVYRGGTVVATEPVQSPQPKPTPSLKATDPPKSALPSPSPKPLVVPTAKPTEPSAVKTPAAPAAKPSGASEIVKVKPNGTAMYDRYMQVAYTAYNQKDLNQAMLYFKRALDERPNDPFAAKAIQTVEAASTPRPSPSTR
jgi:hypothetical protein